MGKSSFMKRKGGNMVTKKMQTERMEDMAALMTALEATLMEWEVWYRLIKMQKKNLTQEQFDYFLNDGPIFTDIPEKIMASVRSQMPDFTERVEEQPKPSILGADGLPVTPNIPTILDSKGNVPPPIV